MPNVIKFIERQDEIKPILSNYDFRKIAEADVEALYRTFRSEFNVAGEDGRRNCWHKWTRSVVDAATFMLAFSSVDDFKNFVRLFEYNLPTRMALPLLISRLCSFWRKSVHFVARKCVVLLADFCVVYFTIYIWIPPILDK